MKEEAKFHWAEGIKLATEAIKMLFFLNGAAAISVITFIGNLKQRSEPLVFAMQLFAFGAALAPAALVLGYLSQMYFGNVQPVFEPGHKRTGASVFHILVYLAIFAAWAMFIVGARYAAIGFGALSF
jgi:hypothetical protein